MSIQTINPATGKMIKDYPEMSPNEIDEILDSQQMAFEAWRSVSFQQRAELMLKLVEVLEKNKEAYATLMANEMGKPLVQGRGEIEKCQWLAKFYAEKAEGFLAPRVIQTEMSKSYVAYKPLGIIFAIMPWNFPFWQVLRFAVPNLMGGNVGILSHAPICTGTAFAIEQLFQQAGFPENVFRSVVVSNATAKHLIENPHVRGVTLTGSAKAGSIVGAEAASALKKVVLELGGSDPYVILADADLEQAAEACVSSRLNNSGQVCISAKRLITVPEIHEPFKQLVLEKMKRYKMGDPLNEAFNFGPIARADLRDQVHQQLQGCLEQGAELLTGGALPDGEGFYYPPTAIDGVKPGMPAYDDEIFGPVVAFVPAKDEADALRIANDTNLGLGGAVFTQDLEKGEHIARDVIESGTVYVNDFVKSDPRLPFGGIKESGYGREISAEGIHEFMNIKTVGVN